MKKYKMKKVVKWLGTTNVTLTNGTVVLADHLKLECGHEVTPRNNGRTFHSLGNTNARCYNCGE